MCSLSSIFRTSALSILFVAPLAGWGAPVRPQLQVTGYVINADLDPEANKLSATADVTFTALEDLTTATFELNNGLQITKLTDAKGTSLESERLTTNSTVRISLPVPVKKGSNTTYHFEYSGVLAGSDTSPVEGIKLAAIGEPISILLYPGRWFPMTGLYTNRFTAEMHIRVPADERVVGSGPTGQKSVPGNRTEFNFEWSNPGFPGTIVAGKFLEPISAPGVNNIKIYVTETHKAGAVDFLRQAAREFEFMSLTFGQPEANRIDIVELPDKTRCRLRGPRG